MFSVANADLDNRLWNAFSVSSLKMQGFLNAIAYGMTPVVRYRWRSVVCGGLSRSKGAEQHGVELPLSMGATNSSSAPGHRKSSMYVTSTNTTVTDGDQ